MPLNTGRSLTVTDAANSGRQARLKRVLLVIAAVLLLLVVAYCVLIGIALYQFEQTCDALVQWMIKALGR